MAENRSRRRLRNVVNYAELNALFSVVLYNTSKRKKTGKKYLVERIIEQEKANSDYEYLIKWQDWPLQDCTWEPSDNLIEELIRGYEKPKVTTIRQEEACRQFACSLISALKGSSLSPIYLNMDLDIWRYFMNGKGKKSQHRGHFLFQLEDFVRLKHLPFHWWYYFNEHGEGTAVDFLIKVKPILWWSPFHHYFSNGKVCKAQRFPLEKRCVTIVRRPCNVNNL